VDESPSQESCRIWTYLCLPISWSKKKLNTCICSTLVVPKKDYDIDLLKESIYGVVFDITDRLIDEVR
jgi:hypothetical protein